MTPDFDIFEVSWLSLFLKMYEIFVSGETRLFLYTCQGNFLFSSKTKILLQLPKLSSQLQLRPRTRPIYLIQVQRGKLSEKIFLLCDKEDIFVKTCRFQVRLGGIIVVIYFFNLMLNRNFGQIEVSDYQILPAIRRIQMRTILLYWFNSSTKKNAIHLDVGISLER